MKTAQFASLEFALANGRRLLSTEPEAAAEQAREILSKDEQNREALRLLGRALRLMGQDADASEAEISAITAAANESALVQTAQAIQAGDLRRAEHLIRPYAERHPDDPAGLRLLGEVAARLGFRERAIEVLRQTIDLAPAYLSARMKLAQLLYQRGDYREALEQLDLSLELKPGEGQARISKASTLYMAGEYQEAARLFADLAQKMPEQPDVWIRYAHLLNSIGNFEESVAAYRRAIELRPAQGDAWWALANLKVARFSNDDIAAMANALEQPQLDNRARTQLHFALGKAFEDAGNFESSLNHYILGNRLRASEQDFDPPSRNTLPARVEAVFNARYFRDRTTFGAESRDAIFILGMPRAGSTLVEQILASHSMIEGTAELPYIPALRHRLGLRSGEIFPESIANTPLSQLRNLGDEYLSRARTHRKTARPYFIDKLPNNWESLGLILTILPNARIVDARRHPMACGFSNFKQLYARGQEFSYSLEWMGRYYADYVRMMRHFDELFPGRVHRVIHEQLIDNPENEIRALLDYIGVPFEESCLRFYENERPVRTPSAGQVRQPLNRQWGEQWRNFEPWLGELKAALGPVLTAYPDVPDRSELP